MQKHSQVYGLKAAKCKSTHTQVCEPGKECKGTMIFEVVIGLMLPFLGTSLGAACVFWFRKGMGIKIQKVFQGFAAGVMIAASIWSLLIPSIEKSEAMGRWSFVPAAVGFWIGMLFLLFLDHVIPHLHRNSQSLEGPKKQWKKTTMLVLAVTLHNIPEGMAVGVVYAGYLAQNAGISAMGALTLAIGIAIQNFPEGAIVSTPLRSEGEPTLKSFFYGVLSGVVEPIAAVITIFAAGILIPVLPYLLSFSAGAMLYVVVEELIPEMSQGKHTNIGTLAFGVGFSLMMILDVALA